MRDDLGESISIDRPRRVVSLVPSITETVAVVAPELLVGATDYCVHPANLDVARVGGSKYPNIDAVIALQPDVVLANAEENQKTDVERLRSCGIPVWVAFPHTVTEACDSAANIYEMLGLAVPEWVDHARECWAPVTGQRARVIVPIWRRPWMVLGAATFATDILARLGAMNLVVDSTDPYPRMTIDKLTALKPDLVIFPDEPYEFTPEDGPEAFPGTRSVHVSGRHLTWHGPSLVEAHAVLQQQLWQ